MSFCRVFSLLIIIIRNLICLGDKKELISKPNQKKLLFMKKLYTRLGIIAMIVFSNSAFSQEKITNEQIQPILNKLEVLGKQNPAGAFPINKLTKEEANLFRAYQLQKKEDAQYAQNNPYGITEQDLRKKVSQSEVQPILDKIKNLGNSPLAFPDHLFTTQELKTLRIFELQNLKPQSASTSKLFNKAFATNGRGAANAPRPFGTLPLVPPHILTVNGNIPGVRAIYADDIADDGKLYALDNASRNFVTVNNAGVITDIGPVTNIPVASTLSGLSWNSVNSTMYAVAITGTVGELYTINMTTGVATLVGTMTGTTAPIWLEIDNTGKAYSADIASDKLYKIDLATGTATEVGALGVNMQFAQEADFNKDNDVLYAASYTGGGVGGIYTINTTTGVATLVGDTTAQNAEYTMFSIADTTEPPTNKTYDLRGYPDNPAKFGTSLLSAPQTQTLVSTLSTAIFADDIDGAGVLYAVQNDTKELLRINNSGVATVVATLAGIPLADNIGGLSWNRADGKMYMVSSGGAAKLYTVDLTTGVPTLVANITGSTIPIWLEIDNNGLAYVADVGTDSLYSLNLTTGVATLVGALGIDINYAQEADFNVSDNKLYMAAFLTDFTSGLYSVDVTTGAATFMGSTNGSEVTMFSIANTINTLAVDYAQATKFSYYPNPTTGILNITASGKIENVEVYNLVGQKVMSFSPKADKSQIDMSSLSKGVYLVKAVVNGKVITNKVIKQ